MNTPFHLLALALAAASHGGAVAVALPAAPVDARASLPADAPQQAPLRAQGEGSAFAQFEAASQAQARGDLGAALSQAQASAQQAPEVPAYRLQWLGLLLQGGDHAQAEQAARQGLTQQGSAALNMLLGAALQAQGRIDEAAQAFDSALTAFTLSAQESKQYRLIAANAALAVRRTQRAQALLAPLAQSSEADVAAAQKEIRTATEPTLAPASLSTPPFRLPVAACSSSGGVAACTIQPGPPAPDAGAAPAQEAYAAYASGDWALAAQKAQQAIALNPQRVPYRLLRIEALVAGANPQQALREADESVKALPWAPELLARRSRLHLKAGDTEAAAADANAALAAGGLSLSSEIDLLLQLDRRDEAAARFTQATSSPSLRDSADPGLGYLAIRVGDDRSAVEVFNRARAAGALPPTALRDAAYAASRLGQDDLMLDYLKAAIDAREAGTLELTEQQTFEARRAVADRSRAWGVNAFVGYRGMSPGVVLARQASLGDVVQAVGEAYWRPQRLREGRFWEVYGGVAQTLYSEDGGSTGGETTQAFVGVRGKPLQDHNLVLSAERRVRAGRLSSNDWLLRVGYSVGSGSDLRLDVPHWTTLSAFAEVGRFVHGNQNYLTSEAFAGRSYRLDSVSSRLVLLPHLVFGVDCTSKPPQARDKCAAGAGVGLNTRYWFREDRHHAPRSFAEFSLQYRARVAQDDRGSGVFVRAALNY